MADHDEPAAVRRNDAQQEDGAAEDRLTSLPEDLLFSVLSFLPIKQCVALWALCSHFRRRLPSLTPRLDTFHLYVVGHVISQQPTFPRALIRQCHIHFRDADFLFERLERLLVKDLIEAGIQDLTLERSSKGWMILSVMKNCCFLPIKSLRSLSLHRIAFLERLDDRHPPAIACTLLTSLKMEDCILFGKDFLSAFLASCPFLETLHFICCFEYCIRKLSIHSTSIKHLVLLYKSPCIFSIDVNCPNLESLTVDVVTVLHIEAPKIRNASLLLGLDPTVDPPDALMKLLGSAFRTTAACLMLNSSTTPNISAVEKEIDRFISAKYKEDAMIFNLDFNLKDQSSIMILTQLLKKCNYRNAKFDICVDSMHIQSTNETVKDDHLLHDSTNVELIKLRMIMPQKMFEGFLSNQKKMMEELKQVALQKLKNRTSREQFNDILASNELLVEVFSSITNCIEMKF